MIKTQSDDPDVEAAAGQAAGIISEILSRLPKAEKYDYGGHELKIGEYNVCERCTVPIAEAQAAQHALLKRAEDMQDPEVAEHLRVAAELLRHEAEAAQVRAELHNGRGSERILNEILGFLYERSIYDDYSHSHHGGK